MGRFVWSASLPLERGVRQSGGWGWTTSGVGWGGEGGA